MTDTPARTVVSVAFPNAIPGIYDYRIPDRLASLVGEGTPVLVPVRSTPRWGMAVRLSHASPHAQLKEVIDVKQGLGRESFASHIELYRWIATYYQCELGAVFKPFVRKGLVQSEARSQTVYTVQGMPPATLTKKQTEALASIAGITEPLTRARLNDEFGLSDHMIGALTRAGALEESSRTVIREADELRMERSATAIALTEEQAAAVEVLSGSLDTPDKPYLLHGITGSGKTHVYIELVKRVLAAGRAAIVLVPEISLTPQTIQRFASEIGGAIAVIHSNMSEGERRDSLEELMSGRRKVVIGVRSAILAPVPNLGLIVVDEEHDGSYKQSEPDPRYHARDVAIMRGKLQRALVVLGSATPSLESFRNARTGKFHLLPLTHRFGPATLPMVTIADMNEEHQAKNWSMLSRHLSERMSAVLQAGRQVILLLNRRGYSTFLLCKDCGFIHACASCSVNLVYHQAEPALRCHQCGYSTPAPSVCPKCGGEHLQYKGTGIQKAEEFLRQAFPTARIARMDQDSTRRKGSHVSILESVARRDVDILLGTQMVAKGLNFPGVALVGVIQADIGLHIPDFRSSEKTFQLLTQVAGRAGRADNLGEVVIQTYKPSEPSIEAAREHDYLRFAEHELASREEIGYPPFCRITRIVIWGAREQAVADLAEAIARKLRPTRDLTVLGPAPAVLARVKSAVRYSILIKSSSPATLSAALDAVRVAFPRARQRLARYAIDVDASSML